MPSRHTACSGGRFLSTLLLLLLCAPSPEALETEAPVLHAADYGVLPGMDRDCAPGLQEALDEAARRGGPVVVQLEAGVHRLEPGASDDPILTLRGGCGVTLRGRGEGTVLLVAGPDVLRLAPALTIVARDPAREAATMRMLACWAGAFTPPLEPSRSSFCRWLTPVQ